VTTPPRARVRRLSLILGIALVIGSVPLGAFGKRIISRTKHPVTTEGTFHGTWYHTSAQMKLAIFIRESESGPEVKLDWRTPGSFRFATDWNGDARYSLRGFPGHVAFRVDKESSDANLIQGAYERVLELDDDDYRKEGGPFRLERTVDGKSLRWSFHPYRLERKTAGKVESGEHEDVFFNLNKATDRVVEFDDIPW
jgi:hypothetical protein